jgi:hypothetical protein
MSLLGCNSKILWHEIFFQIVDIISVKPDKFGIILCKNFHLIHAELLDIFYSYMQQYNHSHSTIKIKFFIITEHLSFMPSQIINSSQIINICRPSKDKYIQSIAFSKMAQTKPESNHFIKKITEFTTNHVNMERTKNILDNIDIDGIINSKEIKSFSTINEVHELPNDIFNIICDNIIKEIIKKDKLSFVEFRDILYDILIYGLDVTECLWYIIKFLIRNNSLKVDDISDILEKTFIFLKYYNNNYRPIYHLESIMFYIINKIHRYDEL